jgi:hypothetical protein
MATPEKTPEPSRRPNPPVDTGPGTPTDPDAVGPVEGAVPDPRPVKASRESLHPGPTPDRVTRRRTRSPSSRVTSSAYAKTASGVALASARRTSGLGPPGPGRGEAGPGRAWAARSLGHAFLGGS